MWIFNCMVWHLAPLIRRCSWINCSLKLYKNDRYDNTITRIERKTIDKLNLRFKHHASKDTVKKVTRQPIDWKKYSQTIFSLRDLYPEYKKELLQVSNNKLLN